MTRARGDFHTRPRLPNPRRRHSRAGGSRATAQPIQSVERDPPSGFEDATGFEVAAGLEVVIAPPAFAGTTL